jgi:hypothetical protein
MTNQEIYEEMKHYRSLRAAACATGNRSEHQRCSDIIELLSEHLVGGAR